MLRTLRISSRPLDDDELAVSLKIEPRQTVNQICRRLRDEGPVDRVSAPNGKIVNVLKADARATRGADAAEVGERHAASAASTDPADVEIAGLAGNSREQRPAEA